MKLSRSLIVTSLLVAACSVNGETPDPSPETSGTSGTPSLTPEAAKQRSIDILQKHSARNPNLAQFLTARTVDIEPTGEAHVRVVQTYKGIPVFGSEIIVHLDANGNLKELTDGSVKNIVVDTTPSISESDAVDAAVKSEGGPAALSEKPKADLQIFKPHGGKPELAWRVQLQMSFTKAPVVFVNAHTGKVSFSYDNLKTLLSREIQNGGNTGFSTGPVVRSEGQAPVADGTVNENYTRLGKVYRCYKTLFGRDSYDNQGSKLVSTVHYGKIGSASNANAFWSDYYNQMLYGDGDNKVFRNLVLGYDVTAHEITHGVTVASSDLVYADESGGLNEGMSDIMGAVCEWFDGAGGNVNAPINRRNSLIGEDIMLRDEALRYMQDPARDTVSYDYYFPEIFRQDPHFSSGIPNLAFSLLSEGGVHPREKSSNVVTGIGMHAAGRIFYRTNTLYLTRTATFADARKWSIRAAEDLYGVGSAQAIQTGNAWTAVGVLPPPNYTSTFETVTGSASQEVRFAITNNGSPSIKFELPYNFFGALRVSFGTLPDVSNHHCSGENNVCEFFPAQNGTYNVLVIPYENVANVQLTVSKAAELCTDNIDNDADGKKDCEDLDCKFDAACRPATETVCFDGLDNDVDGKIDCADPNCQATPACNPETLCSDGIDNNFDGLTDCDESSCSTAAICSTTGWTQVSNGNFELGMAPYVSGGADAARVSNAATAASGTYSVRIRDNNGDASSFSTATGMNLSSYSRLKVNVSYYTTGMEPGDNFIIEVLNGDTWEYGTRIVSGTTSPNNTRKSGVAFFNLNELGSKSAVKIRVRSDATDGSDVAFIDNVVVSAK